MSIENRCHGVLEITFDKETTAGRGSIDHATHYKIVSFIWPIADDCLHDAIVRGKYPDVILPMLALRRIDCLLEDTKEAVLAEVKFQKEKAGHGPARSGRPARSFRPSLLRLGPLSTPLKNLRGFDAGGDGDALW